MRRHRPPAAPLQPLTHHSRGGAFLTDLFPGEGRRGAQRTAVSQEAAASGAGRGGRGAGVALI